MPQVLKEEVRDALREAALATFADVGYEAASMAMIAARANTGAASIYRYFPSKEDLFLAAIPPSIVTQFETLLDARVRALAHARRDDMGDEMLTFWLAHRRAVVILLDRAAGSPHAEFAQRFVDRLWNATLANMREQQPGLRLTPAAKLVLRQIFENTRVMLATILAQSDREKELRAAINAFWAYQVPGLRGFAKHVADHVT